MFPRQAEFFNFFLPLVINLVGALDTLDTLDTFDVMNLGTYSGT